MEFILITNSSRRRTHIGRLGVSVALFAVLLVAGGLTYTAFYIGQEVMRATPAPVPPEVTAELADQRHTVTEAIWTAEEDLNALAQRLGELQAHIIRLNALGARLVSMAAVDSGEFDFSAPPARGGPEVPSALEGQSVSDFLESLRRLAEEIDDREPKLTALEGTLMRRKLNAEIHPAGRPIRQGWMSSYFGMRTDPISGRRAFHEGVDFAGQPGSDVLAVASGVVVVSGRKVGYGNTITVNHGNGYMTRYAHNKENLVKFGDTVKNGQRIALMGRSGRSTGDHVHFEVLHKGKPVDPLEYIKAAK